MQVENLIIGAGFAGLGAAYALSGSSKSLAVLEKSNSFGGMCGGFNIDGFYFDNCVHLGFSKHKEIREIFFASASPIFHLPDMNNYYYGKWLKHPAQNNLAPLDNDEKVKIIADMFVNKNKKHNFKNFAEYLRAQYGNYFAKNFSEVYTRKYWTMDAKNLGTRWLGVRFYTPSVDEVLHGAFSSTTPNTYYVKEQYYPKVGAYKNFVKNIASSTDIIYNAEVVKINPLEKSVTLNSGEKIIYKNLYSSIPLNQYHKIIKDMPERIRSACRGLYATSAAIVSLGFLKPCIAKRLWFYVYDEDKLFSRVYSPSRKSPSNAPSGCSSLQAEIYFSKFMPLEKLIKKLGISSTTSASIAGGGGISSILIAHVIDKFIDMGICEAKDIVVSDCRVIKYANVIFNHAVYKNRKIVLDYLKKQDIIPIGRYGKWEYFWSDESFLDGLKSAGGLIKA